MEWRRHVGSAVMMAVFLVFNTATSKDPGPASSGPASSASGSVSSKSGAVGAVSQLPDLSKSVVDSALGCPGKGGDACRVLDEFASATAIAEPTQGQEVYVGYSYGVSGGKPVREYFFLQLKPGAAQAPAGVAAASVLPVSGAARALIPENADEEKDSAALVAALKAGGKAPAGSKAAQFMRTAAPPEGYFPVLRTQGASVKLHRSDVEVFIRRKGDRVLVIEHGGGAVLTQTRRGSPSAAWCAELWRLP